MFRVFENMSWLGIEKVGAHMGTDKMFSHVNVYRREEKIILALFTHW